MPEEQTGQSFGQYLQAARLKAGYDLDYVSSQTKVSPDMLRAIEEEDYGKLPEPVYVMGFIRSFAFVVGADGDLAVRDYSRNREVYVDLRQSESEYAMRGNSAWPKLLIVAVVAALIAAVVYFGYSYYQDQFGGGPSGGGPSNVSPAAEKSGPAGQGEQSLSGNLPRPPKMNCKQKPQAMRTEAKPPMSRNATQKRRRDSLWKNQRKAPAPPTNSPSRPKKTLG